MLIVCSRSYKKVSALLSCCVNNVSGVLLADKTGEIGFINDKNVAQIPAIEDVK
jgi:hypothetical protein